MKKIDKKALISQILATLSEELRLLVEAAKSAHVAATGEESKAEDQYDTRGLEASYLAGAQAKRAADIEKILTAYKFFNPTNYTKHDAVGLGALVELESIARKSIYFLVTQGGGISVSINGQAIQVITTQSPLGDALLGHKIGQVITVETRDGDREYNILSIQ